MNLDPESTTNALLIATVGGLMAGPIGFAAVEAFKRLGLRGRACRLAAWVICTILVVAALVASGTLGWAAVPTRLILLLAAGGGVAGAGAAHTTHRVRQANEELP